MRGWSLLASFMVATAIAWTVLAIAGHVELTAASASLIVGAAFCVGAGVGMVLHGLADE